MSGFWRTCCVSAHAGDGKKITRVCGDFFVYAQQAGRSRGSRFPSTSGDRDLRQERCPYRIRRVRPGLSSAHAGRALLKRGKAAFAPAPRHSPHLPPSPTRTQRDLQVIARHQVRVHGDAPAVVASRAPSARGSATPHSRKARWFCPVTTTFGRSADAPGRGYERYDAARADRSCSHHSWRDARARSRPVDARRGDAARPPSPASRGKKSSSAL